MSVTTIYPVITKYPSLRALLWHFNAYYDSLDVSIYFRYPTGIVIMREFCSHYFKQCCHSALWPLGEVLKYVLSDRWKKNPKHLYLYLVRCQVGTKKFCPRLLPITSYGIEPQTSCSVEQHPFPGLDIFFATSLSGKYKVKIGCPKEICTCPMH
jgi:hypothetical protein